MLVAESCEGRNVVEQGRHIFRSTERSSPTVSVRVSVEYIATEDDGCREIVFATNINLHGWCCTSWRMSPLSS